MNLTDTHSHLYEPEFDADREEALARAAEAGVERLLLPAIDSGSHDRLFGLCRNASRTSLQNSLRQRGFRRKQQHSCS